MRVRLNDGSLLFVATDGTGWRTWQMLSGGSTVIVFADGELLPNRLSQEEAIEDLRAWSENNKNLVKDVR